ncbi:MAG: tetratricopeptide repeat protein [Acidithiobacillus sp.]
MIPRSASRDLLRFFWIPLIAVVAGCATNSQSPVVVKAPTPKISSAHLADLSLQLIARMESEKKWYAAISYLDRYQQSYPVSDTSNLLWARALAATGSTEKAEKYFNALLSGPLAAQGYQGLGLLAADQGHQEQAIRDFIRASRHDPINANILNNLGYAYLQHHALDHARAALFRAGELAPGDARIWSNIALYYLLRNETYRAEEVIGNHQLGWRTQKMIHAEAARLMNHRAPSTAQHAPGPAAPGNIPAPFPNQPLTQMFSANPAQSINPLRTAP